MSREIAAAPPARGGAAGLWRIAREPGTQEALRSLSVLGQYWSESMRELDGRVSPAGPGKLPVSQGEAATVRSTAKSSGERIVGA